ncbi:MAG: FliM/FliN family flagellar motor switch protein [Hyphomicrobium sp.]|nr:FliM/FliN family flagellar motor switch protein [Hyphomicrobium sp.]
MTSGDKRPASPYEPQAADFATELTAAAEDALRSLDAPANRPAASPARAAETPALSFDAILKIPVTMKVIVGSVTLPVADLKKFTRGDTIALDSQVGDPVEITINGHTLARGVLVIADDATSQLGVSLTELVSVGDAPAAGGKR